MAKAGLLLLSFALLVARGWGSTTPPAGTSEPPDVQTVAPTEDETLQNEADNQENVLSQVGCWWSPTPSCLSGGGGPGIVITQRVCGDGWVPSVTKGEGI